MHFQLVCGVHLLVTLASDCYTMNLVCGIHLLVTLASDCYTMNLVCGIHLLVSLAANDRNAMDVCDLIRVKSFHEEYFAILANGFVQGQIDHWGEPVQMQPQIISKINPELALEVLELLQKNVR
jgi:hypothetical protein